MANVSILFLDLTAHHRDSPSFRQTLYSTEIHRVMSELRLYGYIPKPCSMCLSLLGSGLPWRGEKGANVTGRLRSKEYRVGVRTDGRIISKADLGDLW